MPRLLGEDLLSKSALPGPDACLVELTGLFGIFGTLLGQQHVGIGALGADL